MYFRLLKNVVPVGGVPAYFDATFGNEAAQNLCLLQVISVLDSDGTSPAAAVVFM